jgi:hypothetical protein
MDSICKSFAFTAKLLALRYGLAIDEPEKRAATLNSLAHCSEGLDAKTLQAIAARLEHDSPGYAGRRLNLKGLADRLGPKTIQTIARWLDDGSFYQRESAYSVLGILYQKGCKSPSFWTTRSSFDRKETSAKCPRECSIAGHTVAVMGIGEQRSNGPEK